MIRRAGPDDLDAVSDLLAAVFGDDPVYLWLLPPHIRSRERRLRALLREIAAPILRHSPDCYVTEDAAGLALWVPPGGHGAGEAEGLAGARAMLGALRLRLPHALAAFQTYDRRHPRAAHWYLAFIAVAQERRGEGIGTALLRRVLDDADRTGTPAYLESTNPRNRTLYRREGFVTRDQVRLPFGGPTTHLMWREPRRV